MSTEDSDENHDAIYLLSTAQQHHVQLSAMADQKANFLLAGTFVAISVIASGFAVDKIGLTMMVLCVFSVISATFAVLAVTPRFTSRKRDPGDRNLLFFGDFSDIELEEYWKRIKPKLDKREEVHKTMAQDIYELGRILRRKKYKYLRWSYICFLLGLVATGGVFCYEFLFGPVQVALP